MKVVVEEVLGADAERGDGKREKRTARDVLLSIWWREDMDFGRVEIVYVNRGAPGDVGVIRGADVEHLSRSFVELRDGTWIPYHRIKRIMYGDEEVFSRLRERSGSP